MSSRSIYAGAEAKGWRPWGAFVPFLGIAFVAATVISLQIVLQKARLIDAAENPIGLRGFIAFLTLPFSALGLVVLAWTRFVERRPLATIGLGGLHRARTFIFGHLTGATMAAAIVAGIWIAGAFKGGEPVRAFASPAALGGVSILLAGFALQSSAEELLFRGWMLSAIATKFGVVAAILISSAIFALLHYDPGATPIFVTNVILFGVFASCWSLRAGTVWGAMGFHAGWNWLFATGFELRVTGLDAHMPALLVKMTPVGATYFTGGSEGPEASICCTLVLTCGIAYVLLRPRREG
jgi:uncharacterized protein